MSSEPRRWRHRSPGDLSIELPETAATPVEPVLARPLRRQIVGAYPAGRADCLAATQRSRSWPRMRLNWLRRSRWRRESRSPRRREKWDAVIAKFDFTIDDARDHVDGGRSAAACILHGCGMLARGPAAVIAPFNFPLHLGNGAALAHLAAGNPVIFKPSPFSSVGGGAVRGTDGAVLPEGVFQLVQGGAEKGRRSASIRVSAPSVLPAQWQSAALWPRRWRRISPRTLRSNSVAGMPR